MIPFDTDQTDRLLTTTRSVRKRLVAYSTGEDFTLADRRRVEEVAYVDRWHQR